MKANVASYSRRLTANHSHDISWKVVTISRFRQLCFTRQMYLMYSVLRAASRYFVSYSYSWCKKEKFSQSSIRTFWFVEAILHVPLGNTCLMYISPQSETPIQKL